MRRTAHPSAMHGFSLVQMSMIIMVGSLIMVSLLPGGSLGSDAEKIRITRERMRAIEDATQAFMAKNFRRPCPADGTVALGDATFGAEAISAGACTGTSVFSTGNHNIVAGTVPNKALSLPDEYALDGYGRRMMYFVDKRAANTTASLGTICRDMQKFGMKGDLRIADNFDDDATKDSVMWALVSYGKDGHGAFPLAGSATSARITTTASNATTVYNALNVDGTSGIGYGDVIPDTTSPSRIIDLRVGARLVQTEPTTFFDDIVWYDNTTKNICTLGKRPLHGFHITRSDINLPSPVYNNMRTAVGDVNGDGIQDLVVTAFANRRAYVVYGSKTGWPANASSSDLFDMYTMTTGTAAGSRGFLLTATVGNYPNFGHTVAVGDVNNDGYDDIVFGAALRYLLVFGNSSKSDLLSVNTTVDTTATTSKVILNTGIAGTIVPGPVAIGDINGDGYDDIVFNNTNSGVTDSASANAYVVFGKTTASWTANITVSASSAATHFKISTSQTGGVDKDIFGGAAAASPPGDYTLSLGDVNGDGYKDIIYGGPKAYVGAEGSPTGKVYVVFGKSTATAGWASGTSSYKNILTLTSSVSTGMQLNITGNGDSETQFGHGVKAGDINNDGIDDILATGDKNLYIVYGTTAAPGSATRDVSAAGSTDADIIIDLESNATVYYIDVADMNGDGHNDLIIGDTVQPADNSGSVHVIYGPASGWGTTATLSSFTYPTQRLYFKTNDGWSNRYVHAARPIDFNHDGRMDIAISDPGYFVGVNRRGGVYLLYGREDIPWSIPDSTFINLNTE